MSSSVKWIIGIVVAGMVMVGTLVVVFIFMTATMFGGKDYDGPQLSTPLSVSDITFVLGEQLIPYTLITADEALFYSREKVTHPKKDKLDPGWHYENVGSPFQGGLALNLMEITNIYAPFDGVLQLDDAGNVFVENTKALTGEMTSVYLHGIVSTVAAGADVHKGDLIGYGYSRIDIGLSVRASYFHSSKWVSYYPQYLYWTTRFNLFPLLSPPDDKGKFIWRYSSPFGMRVHPITHVETMHDGLDIAVPSNTPVIAVEDGTIESIKSAKDGNAGGNRLYLVSVDGTRKYGYMHLNTFLVKAGDQVRKGQRVALSGNTGRSTGAHLHFSFYDLVHDAEPTDPEPAVRYWALNMDWESFKNQGKQQQPTTPAGGANVTP